MKTVGKDLLRSTLLDTRLRTIEKLRDKIYDPVNIPPYPSKTFDRNQQNRWEAKLNRMRLDAISKHRESYATEKAKTEITAFLDFLLKQGYCDADVYVEPPTAIDQYFNPKLR